MTQVLLGTRGSMKWAKENVTCQKYQFWDDEENGFVRIKGCHGGNPVEKKCATGTGGRRRLPRLFCYDAADCTTSSVAKAKKKMPEVTSLNAL
jgi:hypothetical protein